MAESLKTTAIYTPKSISELTSIIAKTPDIRIFAGGVDLMSDSNFYPNLNNAGDLVILEQIPDFFKTLHNDKYIEVGCMVTIQSFLNTIASSISKETLKAIASIGSSIIRNQATIGGSLCTKNSRFSMSVILSAAQAIAEVKIITHLGKNGRRFRTTTKWVSVAKLYDSQGKFLFADDAFITRIRIPVLNEDVNRVFNTMGSPVYDRENCVMFAFQYSMSQTGTFTNTSLCVAIPQGGFFYSPDFNNLLTSVSIPASIKRIQKISEQFEDALNDECPGLSSLQTERAKRMLQTVLFKANTLYLAK